MNLDELNTSLEKGIYKFYNKEFTENIELFDNTITRTDILIFENCVFQEISIYEIKNPYLTIKFHRCIFESDLKVIRCSIYLLQISSLIKIKDININYGKFNFIDINSDSQPIYGNIKIHKCIIDDDLGGFSILDSRFFDGGGRALYSNYRDGDRKSRAS